MPADDNKEIRLGRELLALEVLVRQDLQWLDGMMQRLHPE